MALVSNRVVDIGAVLVIFIGLLATSRLYTKRQHDEIVNFYKETALTLVKNVEKMIENDDLTHSLLKSILNKAEESEAKK
jgi:phage gp36-like protein